MKISNIFIKILTVLCKYFENIGLMSYNLCYIFNIFIDFLSNKNKNYISIIQMYGNNIQNIKDII